MRQRYAFTSGRLLLAAAVVCLGSVSETAVAQSQKATVEGSYLLEVLHDGFPPAHALVTLMAHGGFIANDTSDLGAGGLTSRDSPIHGSWEHAGGRTIKVRTLYFAYDPDGIPLAFWRSDGSFEFDPGFESGAGSLVVSKFLLDQDPLDPDEVPQDTLNATLTARRITVP